MSGSIWRERISDPITRVSVFQFVLYMPAAVIAPYQAIWMAGQGIEKASIGLLNAIPFAIVIVLNFFVGRSADRAKDWRQAIVFLALLGGVTSFALLFASDFWTILIAMILTLVPFQLMLPVTDSATMRLCRRLNVEFGRVRIWGTLGFVPVTILAGAAISKYGAEVFVPIVISLCVLRGLIAIGLPRFRAAVKSDDATAIEKPTVAHPLVTRKISGIFQPWFILPLIGAGMVHGSHMMQMSMGALLWQEEGISGMMIGILWAVGPASEIVLFLNFARMARRFSARHLLVAGAVAACIRWVGLALEPNVWGIIALQSLNMFSFGLTYLGITSFIANWTADEIGAQAQSIFSTIRQVFIVSGLAGFGMLAGLWGAHSYFVAAGMAVIGGVMILISLLIMNPSKEASDVTT